MKRFLTIFLAIMMISTLALADGFDNLNDIQIAADDGKDGTVYYFITLNPLIDNDCLQKIFSPDDTFKNLSLRGVPVTSFEIMPIMDRDAMVITLSNNERYFLDCVKTHGGDHFVLEESIYQLCKAYFGDEYDYFPKTPEIF
ncbi:MAG: hypothetical protein IKR04_07955 [Clostridia bacterium]|nr:hypothetical protein [Clostridia bacterium]